MQFDGTFMYNPAWHTILVKSFAFFHAFMHCTHAYQSIHIMLRDELTQLTLHSKTVTGFRYPRACRIIKYQFENRSWEVPRPTFFKTWFLLQKLWLKLAKLTKKEIFGFFLKSHFFNVIILKLFHDLKNVKIAVKSLKIGQLLPILDNFNQF
jgi:hypothetical protein